MNIILPANAAMINNIRLLLSLKRGNVGSDIVFNVAVVNCKFFCFIFAIFRACNTCK